MSLVYLKVQEINAINEIANIENEYENDLFHIVLKPSTYVPDGTKIYIHGAQKWWVDYDGIIYQILD